MSTIREKMLILGVGGTGINQLTTILEKIQKEDRDGLFFGFIGASQTEQDDIHKLMETLPLDSPFPHVILPVDGTGRDPEWGKKGAENQAKEIESLVGDYPVIIFVYGTGGGTGAGSIDYITEKFPDKTYIFVGSLPDEKDGYKVFKNTVKTLRGTHNLGKYWLYDNRLSPVLLDEMNASIATDIIEVLNLPEQKSYIRGVIDSGNWTDLILDPITGRISVIRIPMEGYRKRQAFENLIKTNITYTYPIPKELVDKVAIILKIDKEHFEDSNTLSRDINTNIDEILNNLIDERYQGTSRYTTVMQTDGINEIVIIESSPVFSQAEIQPFVEIRDRLAKEREQKFDAQEFAWTDDDPEEVSVKTQLLKTEKPKKPENKDDDQNDKKKKVNARNLLFG